MAQANRLLIFWLLVLITQSSTISAHKKTLWEVALYIIREHITKLTSTIVVAERSTSISEAPNTNIQALDIILQQLHGRIAVQFFVHDFCLQPNSNLEYFVFIADSLKAFKGLFNWIENTPQERHFRFLIILTKQESQSAMEDFFTFCYNFDVIDINIITNHPTRGVEMFTYFPFSEIICRQRSVPILLYSFNEGLEKFKNIFPDKFRNFHGCPFKVSARIFPPYFSFIGNESYPEPVGDWENVSGLEGNLIKVLSRVLNFTIELQPFTEEWCYFEGNQTYGCLEQLRNGTTDIAIGGFVDSNEGRWIFSPTDSYHTSAFLFVVRGKNLLNSLARLAKPFSIQVWMLVASFVILTILFTSVLKVMKLKAHQFIFGTKNHNPVTNFLAVFLGYPISQPPRRNFARYIFVHLLFLTLVLRNAYQGSLYDAFRRDKFFWTPSGCDDLIKWNYTLLLSPEAFKLLDFPEEHTHMLKINGYYKRLEMLEELEGRYATVAFEDGLNYYSEKNIINRTKLIVIPEVIYNYQFVMFLPKHSIFLSIFNYKLKDLAAAGTMAGLTKRFLRNDQIIEALLVRKQRKIPLINKRLYALYSICGVLIGISMVVFCLEVLAVRYRSLQRIFGKL